MGVVSQGLSAGMALASDYTVSEWADANVVLTSELAAEPGPYRVSRTPYAREMLDVLNDPNIEMVTYHTSSQVAKTTSQLICIGYFIEHDPCPMMMILPTNLVADTFSKSKLGPFINGVPSLVERVGLAGSRTKGASKGASNTLFRKEFPGGFISLAGANVPSALAMQSIRIVLADEIDRFPVSAGKEGDPLLLGFKRAQTFSNRKLIVSSTPTVKGLSRIDDMFAASDQRYYHVKMPCCGKYHALKWENVRWKPGHPDTAEYVCMDGCGSFLSDAQIRLATMSPENRWIALRPEVKGHAGFHIWQIYSPWSNIREIVAGYEKTKPNAVQHEVWWNTTLGESWDQDSRALTTGEAIYAARVGFAANTLPDTCCSVVASVDVQGDRLEVLFVGYGPNGRSWLLAHQVINGDPTAGGVWTRLEEVLQRRFMQQSHPTIFRAAEGVAIDSGYLTQRVYEFCEKAHKLGRPWFAVKGQSGEGRVAWSQSKVKLANGAKLHNVGTDALKTEIYARLASEDPAENNITVRLDDSFDLPKCEQMVSERIRVIIDGRGMQRREWFKPAGVRNEMLDLMVYAEAICRHLDINYEARIAEMNVVEPASTAELATLFN